MLGEKIRNNEVNTWLVNTGWTGGGYGVGKRIPLAYTRALIKAALSGELQQTEYETEPVFCLEIPRTCAGVPPALLNPRKSWEDKAAYDAAAAKLHRQFEDQMKKIRVAAMVAKRGVFRTELVRMA
jgi:phosphoenolpyruvate carboxykinase (ATP)